MPEASVEAVHDIVVPVWVILEEAKPVGIEGGVVSEARGVTVVEPLPEPAEYID